MTTSIVAPEIHDLSSIKRRIDSEIDCLAAAVPDAVSGAIRPVAAKLLTPGVACPGTSDALCPRRERVKGRSSQ
jgi:hypothetical protein